MVRGTYRRAAWRPAGAGLRAAAALAGFMCAGLGLASCSTAGSPLFGGANSGGTTVAFESIDGPPEAVFNKLIAQLTEEAGARKLSVVSREKTAQYRIRAYVAAHTLGKRATLAWVWDIYTADRERAMRLSGEVPGAGGERNAWAAADDRAIGRMARDCMDRLAAFLAAPPADAPAPSPVAPQEEAGPAVAFAPRDDNPLAYLPPARP
jgi:hypothetical protein